MTATVEAPEATSTTTDVLPSTFPRDREGWMPILTGWMRGEVQWTHVNLDTVATIVLDAMAMVTSRAQISDDLIREHVVSRMVRESGYNSSPELDDERVIGWFMNLADDAEADDDEPEPVEAGTPTIADEVRKAFDEHAPNFLLYMEQSGHPRRVGQIIEVIAYQVGKWRKGKNLVENKDRALMQFDRRMNREHSWTTKGYGYARYRKAIVHILDGFRLLAKGESFEWSPLQPEQEDVQSRFQDEAIYSEGEETYYIAYAAHVLGRRARADSKSEMYQFDDAKEKYRRILRDYLNVETIDKFMDEHWERVYSLMEEMYYGKAPASTGVAEVVDLDSLITWQVSHHEKAGDLQKNAIDLGIRQWFDEVRTKPDEVADEGLDVALRRWVKAFGFTKFTGKVSRSALRTTLGQVFEAHKGSGMTTEEWLASMDRYRTAVSYVSGRHGEANGMCSQLEVACKELGVDPTRKPKNKVRFTGSNVVVEVEVESWWDDESRLQTAARQKWNTMTDAEKEAAVVERSGIFVDWGRMAVTR